jgi:hypothetical protein
MENERERWVINVRSMSVIDIQHYIVVRKSVYEKKTFGKAIDFHAAILWCPNDAPLSPPNTLLVEEEEEDDDVDVEILHRGDSLMHTEKATDCLAVPR